jgi:DNA-binding NtrC family response regulator
MPGRVLIIDDDPTQRRILEEMIKRSGLEVISLDSASKALDLLSGAQAHGVKLIILDLIMPGMDGLEFLNRFQAVRNGLPVIVQTAQGSIETVVRAMRTPQGLHSEPAQGHGPHR